MLQETRIADAKGRVLLTNKFANATLLVQQVSDTEFRVRLARTVPVDEITFAEEALLPLSDRDRDLVLALLDNPPPPTEALKKAMRRQQGQLG